MKKKEETGGESYSKEEKSPPIKSTLRPVRGEKESVLETYDFMSNDVPISVRIFSRPKDFVPTYEVSISSISKNTEIILEKIRQELIEEVSFGISDITAQKKTGKIEEKFKDAIAILVKKHFPDVDDETRSFLISYLIQRSLGMGNIEILMDDDKLEEVAVNSADEPVWVYHRKHGWLKTNVHIENEDTTKHYAASIGRRIGRQISVMEPLLDAHLKEGDRANATLMPISTRGNTLTLRKYSRDPFTITHFLRTKTISASAAAMIWFAIQYEMSAIIAGGTASGKTATLNVLATFIPPNQRIISIEDTRELRLPNFLHWVPLNTRLPNPEGKGGVSMADLLVNSLRMRPDRILVGEVRRQREAETLFEAIHTGHSCYATFHANNAEETLKRFTNPPINVPKTIMPSINLIITQFRNRRTGVRRTFQIAEILPDSGVNVLQQYDPKRDVLRKLNDSKSLMDTLKLYTGYTTKEINQSMQKREKVLKYLVKRGIDHVDNVGRVLAEFFRDEEGVLRKISKNKPI